MYFVFVRCKKNQRRNFFLLRGRKNFTSTYNFVYVDIFFKNIVDVFCVDATKNPSEQAPCGSVANQTKQDAALSIAHMTL